MITRHYEPLQRWLQPNKVLVVFGPRRAGKTTMLANLLRNTTLKYKLDTGDDIRAQQVLGSRDLAQLLAYAQGYELIAIDEAQYIPNIGWGLKMLVDHIPGIQVVVTGSSSFELGGQIGEPLTGRKTTITLHPFSQEELLGQTGNAHELRLKLEDRMILGSYPDVVTAPNRQAAIQALVEITNSYLFKDVFSFEKIRNSRTLTDLAKMLAFQVGAEVSLNELATHLGIDVKTVSRYIDIMEKAFVVRRVGGFSGNLRNEITKKQKIYFLDNGIRNAVIAQFNPIVDRNDSGQLWENLMLSERLKYRANHQVLAGEYFWRNYQQQEVDLLEQRDGRLFGYEFKWSETARSKPPSAWQKAYPEAEYKVITPANYLDFVG